jgi:hypothetical protein
MCHAAPDAIKQLCTILGIECRASSDFVIGAFLRWPRWAVAQAGSGAGGAARFRVVGIEPAACAAGAITGAATNIAIGSRVRPERPSSIRRGS